MIINTHSQNSILERIKAKSEKKNRFQDYDDFHTDYSDGHWTEYEEYYNDYSDYFDSGYYEQPD